MKKILISCALALPLLAPTLQAQTTAGWRGVNTPANPVWSIPANWSTGRVPIMSSTNAGDKATLNSSTQPPCFLNSAGLPAQFIVGDNNPGVLQILSGGSLTSSNFTANPFDAWNAIGYNHMARLEVQNGGSLISSNHLWVGFLANARGNLVINGGSATVLGMFAMGGITGGFPGIGTASVNAGTLNLAQWNDTASISALSQLDIRAGRVYITNDHTASISNYIAGGQVTGYGGVGTVQYTYDTNNNVTIVSASAAPGAGGPYPITAWPTNINPNLMVHYWIVDGSLTAPNPNWTPTLGLATGSDPVNDVVLQGLPGKQTTTANINVFDQEWQSWNTNGLIDILVQVYGDANLLRSATDPFQGRRVQFLTGTLPTDNASFVWGGMITTNIYNSQWNWLLFTITNNFQSNLVDRLIGTLKTNATGSTNYGGINGGTIRLQGPDSGVTGWSIRAVAFGQHGAFGTAPDINQFALPTGLCPPVLDVNLAGIDFNGPTNNVQVINDAGTGQEVTYQSNVGPADDKRNAVIPTGYYLNFGILSNYLGRPCNDNVAIKVCVDYYDDPAFAGLNVVFGPQTYATDNLGTTATLPTSSLAMLQGTGRWIRRSWTIANVNLMGVNVAPLTGGPQFLSGNGQVAVSRFEIAALRSTGPLAGQDPLAGCYQDPDICTGVYGNYAELDLANGITNGVDVGSSSGDQTFVVEMAGPAGDQRLSVSPDQPTGYYLNFQILTNALGPTTQGNLYLATMVTYYDDPALAGQTFRPEVWQVQQFNTTTLAHMSSSFNMILQGTGKWRDAYWEIGAINLAGVNQGPQAAARFSCGGPVHISRIRYAVIRPCGATAGQNLLSNPVSLAAAPDTNSLVRVSWPYRAPQIFLEGKAAVTGTWSRVSGTPAIEGGEQQVLRLNTGSAPSQFYRLNLTP